MATTATVKQGAATSVLVATSPQLHGMDDYHFEDCNAALRLAFTVAHQPPYAAYLAQRMPGCSAVLRRDVRRSVISVGKRKCDLAC
jgi:hypothetical protein